MLEDGSATRRVDLSVILPVYNEAAALDAVVGELRSFLGGLGRPFEVILVESGSTDGSGALADRLAAGDPAVVVIHEGARRGVGSALTCGFDGARGEIIVYTDSDLPFGTEPIRTAADLLREADAVVGYTEHRHESVLRWAVSRTFCAIASSLFRVPVRDVNCGFKGLRRSVWRRVDVRSRGAFFDAELFCELTRIGARLAEIPVSFRPRLVGRSKIALAREIRITLVEMAAYARRQRRDASRAGGPDGIGVRPG